MNQSYRGNNGRSRSYRSSAPQPRKPSGRPKFTGLLVVLVLLIVAGAGVLYMINQTKPTVDPSASATQGAQPASDKFAQGVFVDDVALGGLTRGDAEKKIQDKQKEFAESNGVTVTDGTKTWLFKISDTTYTYDTGKVLDEAYEASKKGGDLSQNPVKLTTTITVDPSKLEQQVRTLAAPYAGKATDAAYTGIDPTTHKPQFTPDTAGTKVDDEALWNAVKQAFTSGTFGTVQMQVVPVPADVTLAALQANFTLLQVANVVTGDGPTADAAATAANAGHTYTTKIKNSAKPRLANIQLVGDAVSGLLEPGKTLSVNDATGPRTAAKGYQIAPVDVGGISDTGLGGGACQVSGTLYNAAIRYGGKYNSKDASIPGLNIMERNHHSIPSAYMALGTDATVDYGSKDLKIRNDFPTPVIIVVYYEKDAKGKYWEHCDIYGPALPNSESFNLVTKLVTTIAPKDGQRKQATNAVPPGTTQIIPAHKGYIVDVMVEMTDSTGNKTDTKIYQDKYDADCEVLAYYKNDPEPTDTPTPGPSDSTEPSPSPSPTPTPSTATLKPE